MNVNDAISTIHDPNASEDALCLALQTSGTKQDPYKGTNGGEIAYFILQNRNATSKVVDQCARKTKKVTTHKAVISHPNVSRDTLVFLFHNGKSDTIQKDALFELIKRGWLEVK